MTQTAASPVRLLSVFSTFEVGGPQVRFAAIANHFGSRYRHIIVAMDGVFDCKARLRPELDVTFQSIENTKGDTIANRNRFRDLLRIVHPDRLVTYNWGAIEWVMANWPYLVPHVHIEDGFGPEEAHRQLLRRTLTRRLLLRRSTVVVPSRLLEHLARDVWKLSPPTVHYIANGIDCDRFADPHTIPLLTRNDRPVIGTVATLRAEKNLLRLLEAFRLVRAEIPCCLVIAGDGPERARLQTRTTELGLTDEVTFTGNRQDTERVYASVDVFALSSDTEQMPTAIIEAMAAGLPIASTDVGDVKSMLSRENLPYVVSASTEELAHAILGLLRQKDFGRQIGAANRTRARLEFSQDRMFKAYGEVFSGRLD